MYVMDWSDDQVVLGLICMAWYYDTAQRYRSSFRGGGEG